MSIHTIKEKALARRIRIYARWKELGSFAAVAREEGLKSSSGIGNLVRYRKAEMRRENQRAQSRAKLETLKPPPGGWKGATFQGEPFSGAKLTWEEKAKRLRV